MEMWGRRLVLNRRTVAILGAAFLFLAAGVLASMNAPNVAEAILGMARGERLVETEIESPAQETSSEPEQSTRQEATP